MNQTSLKRDGQDADQRTKTTTIPTDTTNIVMLSLIGEAGAIKRFHNSKKVGLINIFVKSITILYKSKDFWNLSVNLLPIQSCW